MSSQVRVRFAPSPTGHLHVGGARTALFNWLFARHNGGTFILRIEDTDAERSKDVYTKAILDGLRWLGIDWDEGPDKDGGHGPYFQTQRLDLYRAAVEQLLREGKVYHCFCSPETLTAMREDQMSRKEDPKYDGRCSRLSREEVEKRIADGEKFTLRLRVAAGENVAWNDLTKGELSFGSHLLDDLVVVKSDGFPTYNFAVVVDDALMKVTHVIRGEDHISNTPKQILIYKALGYPVPQFSHIPMILGADRSRLSKRHGATSVIEYKDMGFEPEAFRNFLALLGWSPETGAEVLTRDEMFRLFSLDRVSSHGAIFNMEKLAWFNAEYIKRMDGATVLDRCRPWLAKLPGFPGSYDQSRLEKMVGLYRERMKTFNEIESQIGWFFVRPSEFDAKGLEKAAKIADGMTLLGELVTRLAAMPDFAEAPLEAMIRGFAEEKGKKAGDIIHLCRLGISGRTATPGLFESMVVLGRDETIERLKLFTARN
ncbi:MAG TPA: glutamate--tRNA ligase [Candidatus Ozemobacteraceae bacterium]